MKATLCPAWCQMLHEHPRCSPDLDLVIRHWPNIHPQEIEIFWCSSFILPFDLTLI